MDVSTSVAVRPAFVAAGCVLSAWMVLAQQQTSRQESPTIRTGVTMVPVDVRVLDRRGLPVMDLRREDFTVLEDGVPQRIAHFSVQSLTPDPTAAAGTPALRRGASGDLSPQNRRVFLVLLGRGRMTGPSDELRALRQFLDTRLFPQDLVAVMAYNRATDFTTGHQAVLQLVERFQKRHTTVESMLAHHFSDLQGQYGSRDIPPYIQQEIDAIFAADERLPTRAVRAAVVPRTLAGEGQPDAASGRVAPAAAGRDAVGIETPSLDGYLAERRRTLSDMGNLIVAVDYLRQLEGEKHLVFVTPHGVMPPRPDSGRGIGAVAGDARVAVHVVYTGGVVAAPRPRFAGINSAHPGAIIMSPVPTAGAVFGQSFRVRAMRAFADVTGGELTAFRSAHRAFARLDQGTRFQYVVGYYPSNGEWDGSYRRIEITVDRPRVKVMYRRGYRAAKEPPPLDPGEAVAAARIAVAADRESPIEDIRITLKAPVLTGGPDGSQVLVEGSVDVSRVGFTEVEGRRVATLDIRIYAADTKKLEVGEKNQRVDLKLSAESYDAMLRDGMAFAASVPLTGQPDFVKVIVYDRASDLLGSVAHPLRR